MAKNVNIHVKTPGAKQAEQDLNRTGKAAKGVGDSASRAGKKGAEGVHEFGNSAGRTQGRFAKLKSSIASWVLGLVGVAAAIRLVTTAIRIQKEAIEEHARIAAEQQKKLLALQAMGTFFEEHPEARKEVAAYAEFGRRPVPEVTEAWYALESKGAGLTEGQKKGIMRESLEFGRMEPEADLESIVGMFSLYAKETRQEDINLIQNVLRATLSKAGAELSEVGRYLPQFQSLGIAAGLTGAESAGLWAYATTRTGQPEKATVGLRNIFMALQGKGTPESQKLLQQLNVAPEMGFYEQMGILSAQQEAGKFGLPEAETIAMKENAALLLSMLTDTDAMMQTVREVSDAARGDIDIVKDKLDLIMGQDEVARLEEDIRRLNITIENIKGRDVEALRWQRRKALAEKVLRERGLPEVVIDFNAWVQDMSSAIGGEPGQFTEEDVVQQMEDFFGNAGKVVAETGPGPEPIEAAAPPLPKTEFGMEPTEAAAMPPPEVEPGLLPANLEGTGSITVNHNYHNEVIYNPVVGETTVGPRVGNDDVY